MTNLTQTLMFKEQGGFTMDKPVKKFKICAVEQTGKQTFLSEIVADSPQEALKKSGVIPDENYPNCSGYQDNDGKTPYVTAILVLWE